MVWKTKTNIRRNKIMSNITNKVFVDKMGGRSASEFIGQQGDLFYDPADGALRVSDGITPGGTPLNSPTTAIPYRGFYASYGSFFGDDPSVNQILISNNQGMRVTYDTSNTDNDDLHAQGLSGSPIFIALNLYGSTSQKGLTPAVVSRFVKAFIDAVCYSGGNQEVGNIFQVKNNFYNNIDALVAEHLPANSLYENFEFYSNQNWYNPIIVPHQNGDAAVLSVYADSQSEGYPYVANGIEMVGSGYSIGDQITIGAQSFGLEPNINDMVVTVNGVDGNGGITDYSVSGSGVYGKWYLNNISDGGNDQYDNGNYLNTNLQQEIPYNNGVPTLQSDAVGGGDYICLYKNSVFAFFTGGCNITDFYYSGNMGADGQGDKVESALFGHESAQNTEAVDQNGNLIVADSSDQAVNVGPGQSHNIPNFSGMLIVNDHWDGGVECWLCGNGAVLLSQTRQGVGEVNLEGNINGYTWTNTSNLNGPFTFTVIKTRFGA